MRTARVAVVLLLSAGTLPAAAQLNNRWLEFQNETATRLVSAPGLGISDPDEKDYAWGDLDRDGDIDLVVVRKEPFTSPGRRANVLFMNEGGVLVDRTSVYASDSDVAGDLGFLTPTNDRDVVVADFNGDQWPDVATAVTISDGLPKHVSHPRIYINKGAVGGAWQGLRFEAGRSPQIYVIKSDGTPDLAKPTPGRFCSIAAGDVDNDGDLDIYLGDYDASGAGGSGEPTGFDTNDRLWINDGNGFFTDSLQSRMTAQMLLSAFSTAVNIADMNGDGVNDVVKSTGLNPPQYVGVSYNQPPDLQVFDQFQSPHAFSPYFVSVGDLNNDNKLDMVVTDDNADRYRLNQGNDALGRVVWSSALQMSFPTGVSYADDGFGSQSALADFDRDGFLDVWISDVDVDTPGCGRRAHLYRNVGNTPNVTMREEAELSGSTAGWKGAVGLTYSALQGTHNAAPFDLDNDGDLDIVQGRCTGTSVWINTLCRLKGYGSAAPNSTGLAGALGWTGTASLRNADLVLRARNLPPGASGEFIFTQSKLEPCAADGDGLRCFPLDARRRTFPGTANGSGVASLAVNFEDPAFAGVVSGSVRYIQFRYLDPAGGPAGYNWTSPLDMKVCP